MLLTAANICRYLVSRGIVPVEAVVDGAFVAIDVSRRNRNFKVLCGPYGGYFVKQIQQWDPQAVAMLQCESACYWLARHDPAFSGLEAMTPVFCSYDMERQALITGLLPDSENLQEHFRRAGRFTPQVSRALGHQLGTYHRGAAPGSRSSAHHAMFPRQTPWILTAERRNAHPFKELSAATSELFDRVENRPRLRRALDALRGDWRIETLIHGDMRFENCVLAADAGREEAAVTIVDWEMADIGDRSWDTGGLLQAYLCAAMMSRLQDSGRPLADPLAVGHQVLAEAAPALADFWRGYIAALGLNGAASDALLVRCMKFGAARMIQSAYEHVQFSENVSSYGALLLELSAAILENSDATLSALRPLLADRP